MVAKTAELKNGTEPKPKLGKALAVTVENDVFGSFFMPYESALVSSGLSPEKLTIPRNYHSVVRLCYDFYQRGGSVGRVIDRLQEFTITEIRNGQRKTTDEQNAYFQSVLHDRPSRMMRHLRTMALEYYLAGMVLPKVEWKELTGEEISPNLISYKKYLVPVFDNYPPLLVEVEWENWGKRAFYLKIPESDIKVIRNGGKIKNQQAKYKFWMDNYAPFIQDIQNGANRIEIRDSDPLLRKEISINAYPTPYLYNVLEPLVFKQQLRRMDFAVAARVINAILLVQEGSDEFPLTEETQYLLDNLQTQVQARQGNPRLMERVFMLFSDHTTKLTWIHPDVEAMLNQDKYRQVNEELDEGLGFPGVLLTGTVRQGGQTSEVSTWAIQPQMEELRSMMLEWITTIYRMASDLNKFRNIPEPNFKPIKLQDMVKTAAVYQQLFTEGNMSRTSRDEMAGLDIQTEAELMKDEKDILKGLPAFTPTPYSPPPPMVGGAPAGAGRPVGSQNTPVNRRNSGVKPRGQKPTSKVKAESFEVLNDEEFINLVDKVAKARGIYITMDDIVKNSPE